MYSISKSVSQLFTIGVAIIWLPLLLFARTNMFTFADDCDNLGRIVHVGMREGDDRCTLVAGAGGGVTKQLEDKFDYDYFLFYIGYDTETPVGELYEVTLTNTRLTRPQVTVGTFYDDAQVGGGQSASEFWYGQHSGSLGGMTLEDFQKMVTLAPNLLHDGVYDYLNGEVVVVQESSDAATREMFYAVPVGTNLGTNSRGEHRLTFTPPDRGAYIIVVSNYSRTRRNGRLTGSYTVTVNRE